MLKAHLHTEKVQVELLVSLKAHHYNAVHVPPFIELQLIFSANSNTDLTPFDSYRTTLNKSILSGATLLFFFYTAAQSPYPLAFFFKSILCLS